MLAERLFEHLLVARFEDVQRQKRVWKKQRAGKRHHGNVVGQRDGWLHGKNAVVLIKILRYGIETVRKPPEIAERQLSGRARGTEMNVVEDAAAAGQLEPRNSSQFSDPHGHDVRRAALTLEEIEERFELRGRVGSRRQLDELTA